MAEIVLGIGTSHGMLDWPSDEWLERGKGDRTNPRMNYDELLKEVKPGIEKELTPEKIHDRGEAVVRGKEAVKEVMRQASPDVYLILSNPHGVPSGSRFNPVFGIFLAHDASGIKRSGHETGGRRRAENSEQPRVIDEAARYTPMPELADQIMAGLIEQDIDVACLYETEPGEAVGAHPYTDLYKDYELDRTTPIVPFVISRYLPNQATPARCYALGEAVRRAIEEWDSDLRVAIVASGGLSHQIIDEELDRQVIAALEKRDSATLCALPRDRLNRANGTAEILNWVALSAAMGPRPMTLIDYIPCYRSEAGTGVAVGLAYWA